MELNPVQDRVVIKRAKSDPVSKGGIIITAAQELDDQGTVVAVGPGRKLDDGTVIPVGIDVGDRVIFSKTTAQTIKVNGEEYLVMREEDILGVITG